jgi:hypothetical protein
MNPLFLNIIPKEIDGKIRTSIFSPTNRSALPFWGTSDPFKVPQNGGFRGRIGALFDCYSLSSHDGQEGHAVDSNLDAHKV